MTKSLPLQAWFTLFCSFCTLAVAFSFGLFSLPVFYPALVKAFRWDRASVAGGGSIVLLLIGVMSPVVGWLADKYSPKVVLLGGICLGALALALLSLTKSLAEYYAFCILLGLATSAVSILPNSLLVAPWFAHRRGIAVGFVNAGIGLGGVAPLLATTQIRERGISGAFVFLACCLVIPFLLTLATAGRPPAPSREISRGQARTAPNTRQLLHMPMFWIFGVSLFFAAHAMLAIQQHLVLYLTGQGVAAPRAALALSVAIWSSAVGKLLSGATADRFSARLAMMLSVLYVGIGVAGVLSVAPASAVIFPVAVIFGFGYGGIFNASPTIIFEYFGTRQVGAAMGLLLVFFGLGTASGGLLAGYLFDRTRSYALPFSLDLVLACAGLLLLLVSGRQTRAASQPALQSKASLA
ncbi:MAG TPA: MFS transporter [Bryobacteraceae bacterium]|nr:MFS transporter [Bryobacteraceae bacterium]